MKKVLMLAAMVLGTAAMVNVQAAPVKSVPAKEVKALKNKANMPNMPNTPKVKL